MPIPRAFRILTDLLRVRQSLVVFISETKYGEETTERIKRSCGFQGCLTVRSAGAKGGPLFAMEKRGECESNLLLSQSY